MADGFTVDRGALSETSKGINDTIGALKGLGFDEEAEVGRGFSGVALRRLQIGHPGLHGAFGDFCDRRSWGVRSLVQDGNEIAVRLGLSAGMYHDTEQYLAGAAKDVLGDVAGNPYLSDSQVENETWSQTVNSSHWSGQAADAFRAKYAPQPRRWADAQSASGTAADSLESYGGTVKWAQGQARQAIEVHNEGNRTTAEAQAAYNEQVSRYNRAA